MIPAASFSQLEASPCANAYCAEGVVFNGSNTYVTKSTDFTGNADSKVGTLSFWVRFASLSGTPYIFVWPSGGNNSATMQSSKLRIIFRDTGEAAARLSVTSGTTFTTDTWYHILASWDMTDTGKRHLYVNGVDDSPTWTVYQDVVLHYTHTQLFFFALTASTGNLDGTVSEFYWDPTTYTDLSVQATREKWILNGAPVFLGSDGSLPSGTSPILYLSGPVADWHTNKGTGGGLTEGGTLVSGKSPSL